MLSNTRRAVDADIECEERGPEMKRNIEFATGDRAATFLLSGVCRPVGPTVRNGLLGCGSRLSAGRATRRLRFAAWTLSRTPGTPAHPRLRLSGELRRVRTPLGGPGAVRGGRPGYHPAGRGPRGHHVGAGRPRRSAPSCDCGR